MFTDTRAASDRRRGEIIEICQKMGTLRDGVKVEVLEYELKAEGRQDLKGSIEIDEACLIQWDGDTMLKTLSHTLNL